MALGKTPGLTWDEPAYVVAGLNYVSPAIPDPWQLNHEHPPLAKLLYGAALQLDGGAHGYLAPARCVSALLFAGLVLLTCKVGTRLFGATAGLAAGGLLILMPQVLAHAHLAALDLLMALAWMAAASYGLNPRKGWGGALILGLLWGLALLTKVNGIFLLAPLLAWGRISGSLRWREMPVVIGTGLTVFLCGWPWLWEHTGTRLHEYLLDKSVRWVVPTFYLGEVYDKAYPPWHYPLVLAAVTMPPAILAWALGGCGVLLRRRPDAARWLGLNLAFTLGLACLPGVPRYDGVRLFLAAFPFVAILAGLGMDLMLRGLAGTRLGKAGAILVGVALLAPTVLRIRALDPCLLSYYAPTVGGLKGAGRLGFETTFWGDAITPELLAGVPEGATVSFAPLGRDYAMFLGFPWAPQEEAEVLVILGRKGMLDPGMRRRFEAAADGEVLREGVPLARIYRRR